MEVRITYRSEIYIEGENLKEIREKWESLNLEPKEAVEDEAVTEFGFVEVTSIEDADTYEDLMKEFY